MPAGSGRHRRMGVIGSGPFHLNLRGITTARGSTREDAKFGCWTVSSPSRSSRLRAMRPSRGNIRCNGPVAPVRDRGGGLPLPASRLPKMRYPVGIRVWKVRRTEHLELEMPPDFECRSLSTGQRRSTGAELDHRSPGGRPRPGRSVQGWLYAEKEVPGRSPMPGPGRSGG